MEQEAKKILADPSNVSRSRNIAPVFALAERYARQGDTNQALKYYVAGLEHAPWNLEAQMALAELLAATGKPEEARGKAQLVWDHAETDALLSRSARLGDRAFESGLPDDEPFPAKGHCVALVPVGAVDAWLIRELRSELATLLHIPVIIRQVQIEMPASRRSPFDLRLADLRRRLGDSRRDPRLGAALRKLNLSFDSLKDDQKLIALTEAVLEAEDKEHARQFREEIDALKRLGPQWDSGELATALGKATAAQRSSERIHLGVTMLDLYSGENRFVFGVASPGLNCGVLSYRRYASAVTGEPPDRKRLKERAMKQALSSVGLAFNLPRCTDPTCARAYANSLAQHDAKQLRLCVQCDDNFAKLFKGQPAIVAE